MRLSKLQKYILKECYNFKTAKIPRNLLNKFYEIVEQPPKRIVNIITRSIESLIDGELLTGYGVRTPHKWFIKEIRLTQKGRKLIHALLTVRQRLPFRQRKHVPNKTRNI